MRRSVIGLVGTVGVGVVAVAVIARGGGGDATRDVATSLGLADDPAFAIRLSGPLWHDRTLRGEDGALDIGIITGDEPLDVTITPRRSTVAQVELRVDGRIDRRMRPDCRADACARDLRLRLAPRLDARRGGRRRIEVIARDRGAPPGATDPGAHVGAARLDVTVRSSLPALREAEPVTKTAPPTASRGLSPSIRRAALGVLATQRRQSALAALIGTGTPRLREVGTLRDGARAIGATLLLDLARPRRNVRATLPGYAPGPARGRPYASQPIELRATVVRDLLVDIDTTRRRVIAVQPGPRSATTRWTPLRGPSADDREDLAAAASAVGVAPARAPTLLRVSEAGPAFLGYDGDTGLDPRHRDWPVSLVFAGRATVGKVKRALRTSGFTRRGEPRYLPYRTGASALRFDGDRGVKTRCDANANDVHLRLYAPATTDRFADPELGDMVVATAHLDHADGCGAGPRLFGFSEEAERRVAAAARRLGWAVTPDALALGTPEPFRRDVRATSHIWLANGRATLVRVP